MNWRSGEVEKWRKKWMRKEKERVKTLIVIRDTVIRDDT
jgi:hypothetical protein